MANNKYYTQAEQQYNVGYNKQVSALKNQLAQNQQNLEQQKTGINSNYDLQVQNQNLSNKLVKNNVSNTLLGRGLANSSIAVSGLAEQDAKNTRLIGDINRGRTADLNNIDQQKALLEQNYNNTIAQMEADKISAIQSLAYQLEDRDWDKDFQNRQLSQQELLARLQREYQYAQLAQQKELSQLEQAYRYAQLAQAQRQFEAEQSWKQEQLAYERQKYEASMKWQEKQYNDQLAGQYYDRYKTEIGNIMADPNLSQQNKWNLLKDQYTNMQSAKKNTTADFSFLEDYIYNAGQSLSQQMVDARNLEKYGTTNPDVNVGGYGTGYGKNGAITSNYSGLGLKTDSVGYLPSSNYSTPNQYTPDGRLLKKDSVYYLPW